MTRQTFCQIGCSTGTDKCCKSHGYHDAYEAHFSRLRDEPIRLLEIGVQFGYSLRLWEQYFPLAKIFGVDIDPACLARASDRSQVIIGDQEDPKFLARLAKEIGSVDILIDDGCHRMGSHQASFNALFQIVKPGGFYVIEDLETCYMPDYYGGGPPGRPGNTMTFLKSLLDDVQRKYHGGPWNAPATISEIHFYDAIAFIVRGKP
jgi:SAM-dependent methyltransferase